MNKRNNKIIKVDSSRKLYQFLMCMECEYMFRKGKREGQICGRFGNPFCSRHRNVKPLPILPTEHNLKIFNDYNRPSTEIISLNKKPVLPDPIEIDVE